RADRSWPWERSPSSRAGRSTLRRWLRPALVPRVPRKRRGQRSRRQRWHSTLMVSCSLRRSRQSAMLRVDLRRRTNASRPSATSAPTEPPALLHPPPDDFGNVVSRPTPLVKRSTWKPLSWLVVHKCSSLPCQTKREFADDQSAV